MKELIEKYKEGKVILFVGAGISMNLGLTNWEKLIDLMAEELGVDSRRYKQYGNFLALAEFYLLKRGNLGQLRSWLDKEWHTLNYGILERSKIHEYIAKGHFPIIYTTNYDNWIEIAHDYYGIPYNKIVTVSDISEQCENVREIVKFHGDFSDDNSIVLTESSYLERLQFESPLDIKLQADILGKTVLFIGYSLSDINIRQLFYKLNNLWKQEQSCSVKPDSYFFTSFHNPVQEAIFNNWGIHTITSKTANPGDAVERFLSKLTGL